MGSIMAHSTTMDVTFAPVWLEKDHYNRFKITNNHSLFYFVYDSFLGASCMLSVKLVKFTIMPKFSSL